MQNDLQLPKRRQKDYERVFSAVKHAILEGRYKGGMLPSYRQLTRELNVTMASVQRAMEELESEGLIHRENRRGVFPCMHQPTTSRKPSNLRCVNIVSYSFALLPSFVEADYLAGYTEALDHLDVRMRFVASNELNTSYKQLYSPILPIEAQAAILINYAHPELVQELQRKETPFVVQSYCSYDAENLPPHSNVYVNKSGGAFDAIDHLLEIGHRRIGYMGNISPVNIAELDFEHINFAENIAPVDVAPADLCTMNSVFDGYRAALIQRGLNYAKADVAHCDSTDRRVIFAIAKAFLERPNRPTAILAGSDEFALGLLEAARILNIRVPQNISIVGFDNQPESEKTDPPLTTVSVPRRELAKSAITLLQDAAENPPNIPQTRILETHLIIRGTTAPPQNNK